MHKGPGGDFEASHHLAAVFRRIAAWLRQRFLIPLPPCVSPSLPLCFLPLEPIHWLEQRLTELSDHYDSEPCPCLLCSPAQTCATCWLNPQQSVSAAIFFFPPWLTCHAVILKMCVWKFCRRSLGLCKCRNISFEVIFEHGFFNRIFQMIIRDWQYDIISQ